jgi:hypothetical protein
MRLISLAAAFLLLVSSAEAQAEAAASGAGWIASAVVAHNGFDGASRDAVSFPGAVVSLQPGNHLGVTLGIARHFGAWELGLGLGYLTTNLELDGNGANIRDESEPWRRLRVELLVARRLIHVGQGGLALATGPTLDSWETGSFAGKLVVGGRIQLSLLLPLGGRFGLENRAGIGWSSSPFTKGDTPAGVERKTLRTLELGAGLRVRL